jgi:glycosyltransferase involved in cell wall biosynthesis
MGFLLQRMDARRPWVAFFHGRTFESLAVRVFDRLGIWCAHAADRIVVVAARHQAYFARAGARVVHLPNAILKAPTTTPLREEVPTPPVSARLLYVGRLSPEKGVDVLLEAIARLRAEGNATPLVIVGDGQERAPLEAQVDQLRLDAVEFVGHVPDASAFYTPGSVLCLPSRTEGMPNVLLEAVAAGIPVVATAVGDVPEMLDDPALGTCVPPEQPAQFADALRAVLAEPPHAMTSPTYRSAQARLLHRYARSHRAEQLLAIYAQLTA